MAPVPERTNKDEDPSKDEKSAELPQLPDLVLTVSDSDSDEGPLPEDSGYQLLPQYPSGEDTGDGPSVWEPVDQAIVNSVELDDFGGSRGGNPFAIPLVTPEDREQAKLWNEPHPQAAEQMDAEQASLIRSAMASITLPSSHHPAWANLIPEEEWKKQLLTKIGQKPRTSGVGNGQN